MSDLNSIGTSLLIGFVLNIVAFFFRGFLAIDFDSKKGISVFAHFVLPAIAEFDGEFLTVASGISFLALGFYILLGFVHISILCIARRSTNGTIVRTLLILIILLCFLISIGQIIAGLLYIIGKERFKHDLTFHSEFLILVSAVFTITAANLATNLRKRNFIN